MVNRILSEDGHFMTALGDQGVLPRGRPQNKRPKANMRHKSMQRVDMTGGLVTDDEDSSDDDNSYLSRKETVLSRRCPGKATDNIQQTKKAELDEMETKFREIMSGREHHKRLLSQYRERREKLRTKEEYRDFNGVSAKEVDRKLQKYRIEIKGRNPMNSKQKRRSTEQHSNSYVPATQSKPTSPKRDIDQNDRLTADYFLKKIQAFDSVINSWCSPESHSDQKKVNDGDTRLSPKKIEDHSDKHTNKDKTISPNALAKKSSRIVFAPLQRKNPKRIEQATDAASPRINLEGDVNPSRIQIEEDETNFRKSQDLTQACYDPSSGLNETISTCSSGRDIEMGGPLPSEKTLVKCSQAYTRSMILQIPSLRHFLIMSGIMSIIAAIYGVGMLFGYLSYMKSTK